MAPTKKEEDAARHRKEQDQLRAKRKASKMSRSDSQTEKDRRNKEYRQQILKKHGGVAPGGAAGSSSNKKQKGSKGAATQQRTSSAFQELFTQRAQGFMVDFRFRNMPPRPPVGPTFCGLSLEKQLQNAARTYKALNAVEVSHKWKLHSEPDLGVPLAPSAMDLDSYEINKSQGAATATANNNTTASSTEGPLHPDDAALLDWKGSMGDTAADQLKQRQDRARAAARLALQGKAPLLPSNRSSVSPTPPGSSKHQQNTGSSNKRSKKQFSRVLNEGMQTWMKKTTYLSNDYSRKVHDFKSLAQTKQELAHDLSEKQVVIAKRREASAVTKSFDMVNSSTRTVQHPTRKHLKPKQVLPLLPNVSQWGRGFTHLVIDKEPNLAPEMITKLSEGVVANVQQNNANARMSCQLWVPEDKKDDNDEEAKKKDEGTISVDPYLPVQGFDLDVIPLKEEDAPAVHFCLWLDGSVARYTPLSSRVQLSTGRPVRRAYSRKVARRAATLQEQTEIEERMAEVDVDMAEKHHMAMGVGTASTEPTTSSAPPPGPASTAAAANKKDEDDEGEDDFGDDSDDSDEPMFGGGGTKAIAAES